MRICISHDHTTTYLMISRASPTHTHTRACMHYTHTYIRATHARTHALHTYIAHIHAHMRATIAYPYACIAACKRQTYTSALHIPHHTTLHRITFQHNEILMHAYTRSLHTWTHALCCTHARITRINLFYTCTHARPTHAHVHANM